MNKQRITTVGELKKFLSDINDDIQVRFSDRNCVPCNPYKWYIYNNAKEFIKERIVKECQDNYLKDMHRCCVEDNAIVIHAEF